MRANAIKLVLWFFVSLVSLAFAVAAWMFVASTIFLYLTELTGRVDHPWTAWWAYANSGYTGFWIRAYLILSAALPLLTVGIMVAAVLGIRTLARRARPLYGNSTWAQKREMRGGAVKRTWTIFP